MKKGNCEREMRGKLHLSTLIFSVCQFSACHLCNLPRIHDWCLQKMRRRLSAYLNIINKFLIFSCFSSIAGHFKSGNSKLEISCDSSAHEWTFESRKKSIKNMENRHRHVTKGKFVEIVLICLFDFVRVNQFLSRLKRRWHKWKMSRRFFRLNFHSNLVPLESMVRRPLKIFREKFSSFHGSLLLNSYILSRCWVSLKLSRLNIIECEREKRFKEQNFMNAKFVDSNVLRFHWIHIVNGEEKQKNGATISISVHWRGTLTTL